jgi:hypothetical protein
MYPCSVESTVRAIRKYQYEVYDDKLASIAVGRGIYRPQKRNSTEEEEKPET